MTRASRRSCSAAPATSPANCCASCSGIRNFALAGVLSDSQPGEPVGKAFPHLAAVLGDTRFQSQAEIEQLIATAAAQRRVLGRTARRQRRADRCAAHPRRGTRARSPASSTSPPTIATRAPRPTRRSTSTRTARPRASGSSPAPCPSTSRTCRRRTSRIPAASHGDAAGLGAAADRLARRSTGAAPTLFVAGVTGSTGSGRKPVEGTHHPTRHSDLYCYNALLHRHIPEIQACARAASGVDADFAFVPHSGPFARGIHVTVQATLARPPRHRRGARHAARVLRGRRSSACSTARRA